MKKHKIFFNIQYFITLAILFFIPFEQKFFPPLTILLTAAWFFEFDFAQKLHNARSNRLFYPMLLFISFYALYVIGMFYSTNIDFGLTDLVLKLPFLLFPIIFFTMNPKDWNFHHRKWLFIAFIIGCISKSCTMIYHSFAMGDFTFEWTNFTYSAFAFNVHPTYSALFFSFATALLTFFLLTNRKSDIYINIFTLILGIFLTINVVFLASKAGYLSTFLSQFLLLGYALFVNKSKRITAVYPIAIIGAFLLIYSILPDKINRAKHVFSDVDNYFNDEFHDNHFQDTTPFVENDLLTTIDDSVNNMEIVLSDDNAEEEIPYADSTTGVRIDIWRCAIPLAIKKLPFGTGTGDIRDDLTEAFHESALPTYYDHFNPHCQYIQVFLTLGILGIIVFLACLVFPFYWSWKKKNFILLIFIALIGMNILFESMFELQVGVSFYATMNGLLILFAAARSPKETLEW